MKKILVILLVSLAISAFYGCESEDRNARVQIWLTDAPGDYDEVNVDIQGLEVHVSEGNDESGWKSVDIVTGKMNLLELTNGLDTLLGTIELPPGKISQIRLKLGPDNSLKMGGQNIALSTPSAQQSGLKLQVNQTLKEGITYKILLDFDAARSIVARGNGSFSLKPVIRTITEAKDGAIRGTVTPAASTPAVYAIVGTDTVGGTFANAEGAFMIRGLPAGSYKVSFAPAEGFVPEQRENVNVTIGNVTDLGVTTIETE